MVIEFNKQSKWDTIVFSEHVRKKFNEHFEDVLKNSGKLDGFKEPLINILSVSTFVKGHVLFYSVFFQIKEDSNLL